MIPRLRGNGYLLIPILVLFVNSWKGSILGSDDAIYAETARELMQAGSSINLSWQGQDYIDKGPVLFLMLGLSMRTFGENEFAMRLPGILSLILFMVVSYKIMQALGIKEIPSVIACLLLISMNLTFFNARRPMCDLPALSFSILGFYLCMFGSGKNHIGGGIFLGISGLTKITQPLPFMTTMLVLNIFRRFRNPKRTLVCLVTMILTLLPWHIGMYAYHQERFIDIYFRYNLFERMSKAIVGEQDAYIEWLFEREGLLVIIFVLSLVISAVGCLRRHNAPLVGILLFIFGTLPAVFSATSLPHYLLSSVGGLVIMLGYTFDTLYQRNNKIAVFVGIAFVIGGFLMNNLKDMINPDYSSGTKEMCEEVLKTGQVVIGTFELYDPSVTWYCKNYIHFYGLDKKFLQTLSSIPLFGKFAVEMDKEKLKEILHRKDGIVTRIDRLPYLLSLCGEIGVEVITKVHKQRILVTAK